MTADLHHVIVRSTDAKASAEFLGWVLQVPVRDPRDRLFRLVLGNDATVEFVNDHPPFTEQHCAFLVDETTFDATRARLGQVGVTTWADPARRERDAVNSTAGGRGLYFDDPDGHLMEITTVPHGTTTGE